MLKLSDLSGSPWNEHITEFGYPRRHTLLALGDAVRQVAAWVGDDRAKDELIDCLIDGRLCSYGQIAKWEGSLVEAKLTSPEQALYDRYGKWRGYPRDNVIRQGALHKRVWQREHAQSDAGWIVDSFSSDYMAYLDWQRSEMRVFFSKRVEGRSPEERYWIFITVNGVEIDPRQLTALFPRRDEPEPPQQRATKYDWEVAFADVAAWLYHDQKFSDLNARGVQKDIIDELRRSFEKRRLPVPEDSSLKIKARIILGALRGR